MPELPEVETIRQELLPHIIGRRITGLDIQWDGMVKAPSVAEFRARVVGQVIEALDRRGKYLLFRLDGGEIMVMHMKMTGSLLINPASDRFTRAVFHLDNSSTMHFWDPRKFGKMWLIENEAEVTDSLGPEPIQDDFTVETLAGLLKGRKAPVKPVLLDQAIMAGIGNMYADEALFASRIYPERIAGSLTPEEIERLHAAIKQVLFKALTLHGASVRNYIRPDGEPGTAHDEFNVAHGVGKQCPNCGADIRRIVVRGRGTYFCPVCQPRP